MTDTPKQFPLGWAYSPSTALSDFLVSDSNGQAYHLASLWPNWDQHAACIYGPQGCGKSHLASSLAANSAMKRVTADDSFDDLQDFRHFVVEDCDRGEINETLLFHLYNWSKEQGGTLLLTARTAPSKWDIHLPDLKSRLGLLQVFEISEADDRLLEMIYYKLFSDRQIQVNQTLVAYLLAHGDRSFAAAHDNVDRLDREALARKCKVSRRLASEIL